VDTAFEAVIKACAEPAPGREKTWISSEFIKAYTELHRLGFAHSVESWSEGRLAGGLYGVTLRGLFAGESMFSRQTDASKVALVHLVDRLVKREFQLLDVQFMTEHLRQFGAIEISRLEYKIRLAYALLAPAQF
jgi:leucyl/phenylalanyl-tRNA--protein transferase